MTEPEHAELRLVQSACCAMRWLPSVESVAYAMAVLQWLDQVDPVASAALGVDDDTEACAQRVRQLL